MRFQTSLMAVAPMVMMARAGVEFDLDETPRECRDICRPIADLYRGCEVDLRGDDNDREEDQLEVQCFCTNDSFDVGNVAAQCQDCIRQRRGNVNGGAGNNNGTNTGGAGGNRDDDRDDWDDDRDDRDDNRDDDRDDRDDRDDWDDNNDNNDNNDNDDDDDDRNDDRRVKRQNDDDWDDDRDDDAWEDINDIVRTCGFSSTSYLASATSSLPAVSVTATRPTDIAQLTTTFTPAPASETGGGSGGGSNNNNGGGNNNNNNDNNDDGGDGGSGAGALAPFWMAGALVAGVVAVWA